MDTPETELGLPNLTVQFFAYTNCRTKAVLHLQFHLIRVLLLATCTMVSISAVAIRSNDPAMFLVLINQYNFPNVRNQHSIHYFDDTSKFPRSNRTFEVQSLLINADISAFTAVM